MWLPGKETENEEIDTKNKRENGERDKMIQR